MAAKIRVIPAQAPAFEVPILYTATIGRTPENTVCLGFSPTVSRQHAVIRCHNGYEYQLMDLGSRNGTYIDDQRVVMPVTLPHGARIRIANNDLIFEQQAEATGGDGATVTLSGTIGTSAPDAVRHAAILVCDIRGFTAHAESLSAGTLAHLLGEWFREAGNIVQSHRGVIDKFIGDAVLAYWQEEPMPPHECERAVLAARELLDLAARKQWPESHDRFTVGIAVHYGRVAFGNVGLLAMRDATIVGNAVNTAFRLESLMKELNQRLLLSGDAFSALSGSTRPLFEDLGEKSLRGKSEAVRVYGYKD